MRDNGGDVPDSGHEIPMPRLEVQEAIDIPRVDVPERALNTIRRAAAARDEAERSLTLVVNAIAAALGVPEGWQFRDTAFFDPIPPGREDPPEKPGPPENRTFSDFGGRNG
jgi:hypothetical protein